MTAVGETCSPASHRTFFWGGGGEGGVLGAEYVL